MFLFNFLIIKKKYLKQIVYILLDAVLSSSVLYLNVLIF